MNHIYRHCSYTMEKKCPQCGEDTVLAKPPKFSPLDKYGSYRRKVRLPDLKKKGLY